MESSLCSRYSKRWERRDDYANVGQGTPALDHARRACWCFEPHAAENVFEQLLAEHDVPVRRDEWLDRDAGGAIENRRIASFATLAGRTYRGGMFIDATYEGDLLAAAGVDYQVGREANALYGEEWNGVQVGVLHHAHWFKHDVSPHRLPGRPASGLLPHVSPADPGQRGEGDRKLQAYCFRVCMSRHPDNRRPFPKPAGYDPLEYELFLRAWEGRSDFFEKFDRIPNLKTDTNNHGPFFAQNDRRVPRYIDDELQHWGLPLDEYVDNDNWSPQLYIREARRMVGQAVMTDHEVLGRRPVRKPVGMGSYALDSHNVQRYVKADGFVPNEGDIGVLPSPAPIFHSQPRYSGKMHDIVCHHTVSDSQRRGANHQIQIRYRYAILL